MQPVVGTTAVLDVEVRDGRLAYEARVGEGARRSRRRLPLRAGAGDRA